LACSQCPSASVPARPIGQDEPDAKPHWPGNPCALTRLLNQHPLLDSIWRPRTCERRPRSVLRQSRGRPDRADDGPSARLEELPDRSTTKAIPAQQKERSKVRGVGPPPRRAIGPRPPAAPRNHAAMRGHHAPRHRPTAKWLRSDGRQAPATAQGLATETEPPQVRASLWVQMGLSHERCFRRSWLVGLGGREPVAEGNGECVQGGLPPHRPPGTAGPGRVQGPGDQVQAL
jgi:hypothetical protein